VVAPFLALELVAGAVVSALVRTGWSGRRGAS